MPAVPTNRARSPICCASVRPGRVDTGFRKRPSESSVGRDNVGMCGVPPIKPTKRRGDAQIEGHTTVNKVEKRPVGGGVDMAGKT
jgi:hypothetical protein